jgi:hypothetical protein
VSDFRAAKLRSLLTDLNGWVSLTAINGAAFTDQKDVQSATISRNIGSYHVW